MADLKPQTKSRVDVAPSPIRTVLSHLIRDRKNMTLLGLAAAFLVAYFLPFSQPRVAVATVEAFAMLGEYARHHVLLCLVPAFFIAGAIMVFLNQKSVLQFLGPRAPKFVAYSVASVSGAVLAVCSCTVLPLFKGIYRKGAGLGPAVSFLYSGPAINVLAIILTAKVLGLRLGVARAVAAILFAFVIGLIMQVLFRREDVARTENQAMFEPDDEDARPLRHSVVFAGSLVASLVFVNWSQSAGSTGVWQLVYRYRYLVAGTFGALAIFALVRWFRRSEVVEWLVATRDFAVQIIPMLFAGVLLAGFLLGRPGHPSLLPESWITSVVGRNTLPANFLASLSGALMYFATLTEVPILQGLMGAGMAQGPALALLLAGPSISLPSLLVIGTELGPKKTLTYAALVVTLSSLLGLAYGAL